MRDLTITKAPETPETDTRRRKKLDLLGHIEKIIELSEASGLDDKLFTRAKSHINFVAQKLKITPMQAVLLSHFIDKSDDQSIRIKEIADSIKCRKIKILQYMSDIDELEKRKFVRCCKKNTYSSYRVPMGVIEAVRRGEEYVPANHKNISISEFFTVIESLFEERTENELSFTTLAGELDTLIEDNMQLDFSKKIESYNLEKEDRVLLIFFCHLFVNDNDDDIAFYDLDELYDCKSTFNYVKGSLVHDENILILGGLLEHTNSNGFSDKENFKLTNKAKNELLAELNIKQRQGANKKGLILSKSIVEKKMFYNEKEAHQIQKLTSLLQIDNFKTVQTRLSESGMRTGFACLFYGVPGTGKTETVHQMARETGRNIMPVDISATKSMWFGESEKIIKKIFDDYKNYVRENEIVPILLFNEADAVIGKRKDVGTSSIDQTENTIQNIILQEMEHLNGIMIATTNLTQNLDAAFERRFLYKIEFEKPNPTAKQSIWQTMIPALPDEDAKVLASRYNFSGGQIENIARKRTVDNIISGTEPTIDALLTYCENELLNKTGARRKIGFTA